MSPAYMLETAAHVCLVKLRVRLRLALTIRPSHDCFKVPNAMKIRSDEQCEVLWKDNKHFPLLYGCSGFFWWQMYKH
ncbi:hypothetical protein EG68_07403 [Paragonimus skrjabini miyazakii]|uniref:Uncharacterized protein n=1 Tax=Paragonimus skrjabini miyazakii TaxID=59628 RepID=A0A8S9YAF1_9TREM|nr:hypothetical protein EG68_07403 [Paragonimus skrjabini miyazakii]